MPPSAEATATGDVDCKPKKSKRSSLRNLSYGCYGGSISRGSFVCFICRLVYFQKVAE